MCWKCIQKLFWSWVMSCFSVESISNPLRYLFRVPGLLFLGGNHLKKCAYLKVNVLCCLSSGTCGNSEAQIHLQWLQTNKPGWQTVGSLHPLVWLDRWPNKFMPAALVSQGVQGQNGLQKLTRKLESGNFDVNSNYLSPTHNQISWAQNHRGSLFRFKYSSI